MVVSGDAARNTSAAANSIGRPSTPESGTNRTSAGLGGAGAATTPHSSRTGARCSGRRRCTCPMASNRTGTARRSASVTALITIGRRLASLVHSMVLTRASAWWSSRALGSTARARARNRSSGARALGRKTVVSMEIMACPSGRRGGESQVPRRCGRRRAGKASPAHRLAEASQRAPSR